jgi:hypothetical protein
MSSARTLVGDLEFGKSFEMNMYDLIKQLDGDLVPSTDTFALFDFVSDKTEVELKSRTFYMRTYPTTIVGTNKIRYIENNPDKSYYFCFAFTDGLFYLKYSKDLFSKFKKKKCERNDRGRIETMDVIHIPIEYLTQIHKRNSKGEYTIKFD